MKPTAILAASAALLLLVGFTDTAPSSSECTAPLNGDKIFACQSRAAGLSFEFNVDLLTSVQRRFTYINCVAAVEMFRCKAEIYCDMCHDVKTFIGAHRQEQSDRHGLIAVLADPVCQRYVKPNFDLEESYCNYLNGSLAFFNPNAKTTQVTTTTTTTPVPTTTTEAATTLAEITTESATLAPSLDETTTAVSQLPNARGVNKSSSSGTPESSPMTMVYSFLICLLVRLVAMMILGCCACYIRKQRKRQAQLEQNQREMYWIEGCKY